MFVIATAALLVFSVTVQAATKYNYDVRKYDSGHKAYKMRDYRHDPSYKNHYAEDYHREPHFDRYGGDAYSEEPIYNYEHRPTYKQSHEIRYRRDVREGQVCIEVCTTGEDTNCVFECRQAFPSCIGLCTDIGPSGPQPACEDRSAVAGNKPFCYVSDLCIDVKRSESNPNFLWSTDACCGNEPCPVPAAPAPVVPASGLGELDPVAPGLGGK